MNLKQVLDDTILKPFEHKPMGEDTQQPAPIVGMTAPDTETPEQVEQAFKEEAPKNTKDASFNCTNCLGEGLLVSGSLCPNCHGTGKI